MFPKFRFFCTAGMFNVVAIDFEKQTVQLDDGDIRKMKDGTLMQSTGLTDKNGKDIFESDIVRIDTAHYNPWRVEWMNKACMFNFVHVTAQGRQPAMNILDVARSKYEIIGNIFEDRD